METKYIYHFTKMSTLVKYILPEMSIRLNSIKKMNDPRETKNLGFSQIINSDDNSSLEENNKEFSDFIKKNIKISSFVYNAKVKGSTIEGFKNTMMWAHYGNNHKGVCIALKYKEIKEKNKEIKFEKIKYFKPDNNFLQIDKQEFKKNKKTYIENLFKNKETLKKLFFQKTWEWSNENEIRALIINGKKKDDFIKIKDCIEMIYLGVECSENYIPSIQKYISPEKIKKLKFEFDRIRIKQ